MPQAIESKFIEEWKLPVNGLFVIAGPCSVESEEQIMDTAKLLKDSPFSVLRGGIWKPRTHPGSFEGIGKIGLQWLVAAGKEINKPVAVEVATPEHVEASLKAGIDVLWVGARTTTNPFSVQAIAEALKGTDIPVLIKNPMNPDIELWLGAIERFNKAGITKIAALHRGFSSPRKSKFRNQPMWRLPIELKSRAPKLPVICDPSHICGKAILLQSVAQEAIDLLFDGLMIETHRNPNEAMSDKKQQITPSDFDALIESIQIKHVTSYNDAFCHHITFLRKEIDDVDSHIIHLLAKRMDISTEIGNFKKKNSVSSFQPQRWEELLRNRVTEGIRHDLDDEFITRMYQLIHEESIRHQDE